MPLRRRLWIGISLILPIAFTVISLTRPPHPPEVDMEVVPMPEMPPIAQRPAPDAGVAAVNDGGTNAPDAGDVGSP